MKTITQRQEEYLLMLAFRNGRSRSITEAAEQFKVSKPTVISVLKALEKQGLITKETQGTVMLTDQGFHHIAEKIEHLRELTLWLEEGLGLTPILAEQEARRMVTTLEPQTVATLIVDWRTRAEMRETAEFDPLPELASGTYWVNFQVRKADTDKLSMGDMGFHKPALLRKEPDQGLFVLSPRRIEYRSRKNSSMKGILDRLWCLDDGRWREIQITRDLRCLIPGAAVRVEQRPEGRLGIVRIRVRASVGLRTMPESEADMIFFLDSIKSEGEKPS